MRREEPVPGERAGHVERSCRTVRQRPGQSHSKGPWDDRVPWEAGVQGVDYWRSAGPEVPINHKGKIQSLLGPNISWTAQPSVKWIHGNSWQKDHPPFEIWKILI